MHERGTCRAPEMFGCACWERAADLERRQALTQRVKRGCGLIHLQCSEASAVLELGHPCLQNEPRAFARRLDAGQLLVGGVRLREADLEQRGVVLMPSGTAKSGLCTWWIRAPSGVYCRD